MRASRVPARRDGRSEAGFALVLVIWGLGLISLIALTVIMAERARVQTTANLIDNARAEALAEAGISLARIELVSALSSGSPGGLRFATNGTPLLCAMPNDALLALAVEDEGGKVDLNTASPKLIATLLRGFGAEPDEADRLSLSIAAFSRPSTNPVLDDAAFRAYADEGRRYGPKQGPFDTVLELDQVIGMRSDLLRAVVPYVTVHSRRPGIDTRVAAPALLAALAGDEPARVAQIQQSTGEPDGQRDALARGIPSDYITPSAARSFLLRAEVRTASGGAFVQIAVVELTAGEPPDVVLEWRGGEGRFGARLDAARSRRGAAAPPC